MSVPGSRAGPPVHARLLAAGVVLAAVALGTARAEALRLESLMARLSAVPSSEGRFTERRYSSLLDDPIVLEGKYRFESPDYLAKSFADRDIESYEVRGPILAVTYPDGRRRELELAEHPALHAYVEGLRGTLAGDAASLDEHFAVDLEGVAQAWRLRLRPRLTELAERVGEIVIHGEGDDVVRIDSREPNGDHSEMVLHSTRE